MSLPRLPRACLAFASLALLPASAGAQLDDGPVDLLEQLFAATTDDAEIGDAVSAIGGPPWSVQKLVQTRGGRMIRAFGKYVYVLDDQHGTIIRVKQDGSERQLYDLGEGSAPQDILVVKDDWAIVARRDDPVLLRLNLGTGGTEKFVDLGLLAHGQQSMSLRTMERDGKRLFVQVQLEIGETLVPEVPALNGVLAVVNLPDEKLVDVEPLTKGIQGVRLLGAPPRLKMQRLDRTLYVSTTDERLDGNGGIEMVDMDALVSTGYALSEAAFGADLGGFVMTSKEGGYFLFHTDIVASTHLKPFTVEGGAPPGPEIFVMLGDFVDSLAYSKSAQQLYLPSGFSSFGLVPGIYVFSTVTETQVGAPIDTGFRPHDVIVSP